MLVLLATHYSLFAGAARGQSSSATYSIETGASLYASTAPHAAGHFSVLKDLGDGKTFSITSIEMRGSGSGQPVYTPMTGVARLLESAGRISFWGLGQGGLAVSDSAVSGLFNGGGAVAIGLTKQVQLVVTGQAVRAPALPQGWQPMVTIGLRLHP
jgi:hypothetical protein